MQRRINQGRVEGIADPAGADKDNLRLDRLEPCRLHGAFETRQGLHTAAGGMGQDEVLRPGVEGRQRGDGREHRAQKPDGVAGFFHQNWK